MRIYICINSSVFVSIHFYYAIHSFHCRHFSKLFPSQKLFRYGSFSSQAFVYFRIITQRSGSHPSSRPGLCRQDNHPLQDAFESNTSNPSNHRFQRWDPRADRRPASACLVSLMSCLLQGPLNFINKSFFFLLIGILAARTSCEASGSST